MWSKQADASWNTPPRDIFPMLEFPPWSVAAEKSRKQLSIN